MPGFTGSTIEQTGLFPNVHRILDGQLLLLVRE